MAKIFENLFYLAMITMVIYQIAIGVSDNFQVAINVLAIIGLYAVLKTLYRAVFRPVPIRKKINDE